jgi:hypothetical protein
MSENIVVSRRNTKNILRKFSKMKKRISFLKRRIITNESQLKRFFSFFHSFFDFFFDVFCGFTSIRDIRRSLNEHVSAWIDDEWWLNS